MDKFLITGVLPGTMTKLAGRLKESGQAQLYPGKIYKDGGTGELIDIDTTAPAEAMAIDGHIIRANALYDGASTLTVDVVHKPFVVSAGHIENTLMDNINAVQPGQPCSRA